LFCDGDDRDVSIGVDSLRGDRVEVVNDRLASVRELADLHQCVVSDVELSAAIEFASNRCLVMTRRVTGGPPQGLG
jgi:hypothetical protein